MSSYISSRTLCAICLLLLNSLWASAQSATPTNNTATSDIQFMLNTMLNNVQKTIPIDPLTNSAGLTGTLAQLQEINPQGPFFLTTPGSVGHLAAGDIAYISCEPSDYSGSNIDVSRTIDLAINNNPIAIVFYSIYAAQCVYSAPSDSLYSSLYTMIAANFSIAVKAGLQNGQMTQAGIHVNASTANATSNDNGNVLGKSPTTAVAMIILYSITGIITALFLIIIIVGAIRAHRHPERYGPRHIIGRPRQSRAKGIARAMLETIPIVKFGDLEDNKPPQPGERGQGGDVEMGTTNAEGRERTEPDSEEPAGVSESSEHVEHAENADHVEHPGHAEHAGHAEASENHAASGPDLQKPEEASGSAQTTEGEAIGHATDQGLACSVCTDDFIKGQDIRVLPCKHKFHPECIDPWLLNVSGTCPLCRIDLHPTKTGSPPTEPSEEAPSHEPRLLELPEDTTAPNDPTHTTNTRNRRSRILSLLNIGRMRHATPEERIEALRTLRNEGLAMQAQEEVGVGRESRVERFGRRLSRAFGSRPGSGMEGPRPVSEIPVVTVEGVEASGGQGRAGGAPAAGNGEGEGVVRD